MKMFTMNGNQVDSSSFGSGGLRGHELITCLSPCVCGPLSVVSSNQLAAFPRVLSFVLMSQKLSGIFIRFQLVFFFFFISFAFNTKRVCVLTIRTTGPDVPMMSNVSRLTQIHALRWSYEGGGIIDLWFSVSLKLNPRRTGPSDGPLAACRLYV